MARQDKGGIMTTPNPKPKPSRRDFLFSAVPAGVLGCLGCPSFAGIPLGGDGSPQSQALQDRSNQNSGMTFEEVYNFSFRDGFIPLAKKMAEAMGKNEFMGVLQEAGFERGKESGVLFAASLPDNEFSTFAGTMRNPPPLYQGALTLEMIEDSARAMEVKITECLWARTFREADAADIGYACICHPDYSFAEGFNPRMRMIRSKTLMQGQDCCDHRWVVED